MVEAHSVWGVPTSYTAYCRFGPHSRAPQFNIEEIYDYVIVLISYHKLFYYKTIFVDFRGFFYFVLRRIFLIQDPQIDIQRKNLNLYLLLLI